MAAGRGRDWTLLGGEDPTPGEVGELEAVSSTLTRAATTGSRLADQLETFGYDVGGSGWEGSAADGFIAAYGHTPPRIALQSGAFSTAAGQVDAWIGQLEAFQTEADDLLRLAEENEARRLEAEADLIAARQELSTAQAALGRAQSAAAADPDSGSDGIRGAHARVSAASGEVTRLEGVIEECEIEAERLLGEAGDLAERHEEAAAGAAARIADAALDPQSLPPFAAHVALQELHASMPDLELDADGDGIITPQELAARLPEILEGAPGQEQVELFEELGGILALLAADPEASSDLLEGLGADGVEEVYHRLLMLGETYPFNPTEGTGSGYDPEQTISPDLIDLLLNPFNDVVGAGSGEPDGAAVIREVLDQASEAGTLDDIAVLSGLARVEGLPPDVGLDLVETIRDLVPFYFGPIGGYDENSVFPEIDGNLEELLPVAISNNPVAIEELIHDGEGFVDGGEELLADLIEMRGGSPALDGLIGDALGGIFEEIIARTDPDDLIVRGDGDRYTEEGVLFDLVQLLQEHDLKVPGLAILEALSPHLPEIAGVLPHQPAPFSAAELRDLMKDLLQDLSPAELEQALEVIAQSVVSQLPESITLGEFMREEGGVTRISEILAGLLGPVEGALQDIHGDAEEQATLLADALKAAAGLIPVPGGAVAEAAFGEMADRLIDGGTDVDDQGAVAFDQATAELVARSIQALYGDEAVRQEVIDAALQIWEGTAASLGGQGLNDQAIQDIREELESGDVSAATFIELPEIVDLATELRRSVALALETHGGG